MITFTVEPFIVPLPEVVVLDSNQIFDLKRERKSKTLLTIRFI